MVELFSGQIRNLVQEILYRCYIEYCSLCCNTVYVWQPNFGKLGKRVLTRSMLIFTWNKRENYSFITCLKFDHNRGYFEFEKRETFIFSQRKFPILYCVLYITHYWREKRSYCSWELCEYFLLYCELQESLSLFVES